VTLRETRTSNRILGQCPAYSEKTVCCGLHTLDAVRGCPYSCSYCTIQTFYGEDAELEADLGEKLARLDLDPGHRYHIGTGQSSDSLVWGNRGGNLDGLLDFAACNPNVLLELKTKSDNVRHLLRREIPPNVVCSWTLNTPTVIRNEEQGAAGLTARLDAARRLADRQTAVGFHFHPMVYFRGWSDDYRALAETVQLRFEPSEIAFMSMGAVTLIKPVIQEIRRRGGQTKILQMHRVPDPHGKLTYPDEIKTRLFSTLYSAFAAWQDQVFFYLCMETAAIWNEVLGFAYSTNDLFETAFLDHCLTPSSGASTTAPGGDR
jgi:spore photoproduct lyase